MTIASKRTLKSLEKLYFLHNNEKLCNLSMVLYGENMVNVIARPMMISYTNNDQLNLDNSVALVGFEPMTFLLLLHSALPAAMTSYGSSA